MKVLQSIGSMWVTFWIQVPIPALFLIPLTLTIATEPLADDRLSLEFNNLFGDPAARHELASHLESRDSRSKIPRRAIRLYELNMFLDCRSMARFLELAHHALTTGQPQHLLNRRPAEKLALLAEKIARFGAYEIHDPAIMRLRAYQLADEKYRSSVAPFVLPETPALGGNGLFSDDQAREIKAYALLLAASKLDGQPAGSLFSRLDRRLNHSLRQRGDSHSRQLLDAARIAPKLEDLNRFRWSDIWTLSWKTAALIFFSISSVASLSLQLGSWVVLGAGWLRSVLVPAVYCLSPLPFIIGYHLIHGVSFAKPLPFLAPVTACALVVYVISIAAMRDWIASRADVSPSEI